MALSQCMEVVVSSPREAKCPVCGGENFARWRHASSLDLVRCAGCTLVLLRSERREGIFEEVEQEFFGDGYLRRQGMLSNRILDHKARLRIADICSFKSEGRLLDLGCGTGELLGAAKEAGFETEGLDYSEPMVRHCIEKYSVKVHLGDSGCDELSGRYDVIVMAHVIEHVLGPQDTLGKVGKMLKKGGILYIATPNIDCLESRFEGWGAYEPYHFWYFNPLSIRKLLEATGFRDLSIKTWEPYSAWLNTSIRSIFGHQHASARHAVHRGNARVLTPVFPFAMGVLNMARLAAGFLLTPLRKSQERSLKGEELIAIATKL
jgi:2-polyprenyl-3-methyl-5-hydroxy-6-metoxy-1,4-benzoquinol methylase